MKEWFKSLSPKMQVCVVVLAIIITWYIITKVSALLATTQKQIKEKTEIQALKESGVKPTYRFPSGQPNMEVYRKFADALHKAMEGMGTDDGIIIKVFSYLNNDLDFIHLDAAFGVRESADNWFGIADPVDMRGWLRDDLSDTMIQQLNNTLKNKGLTKRI